MNLTFGICWIEDQASDAEVQAVELAIRSAGFEPAITKVENEADIREFARKQEHFQDYDLILLDLRLGGGLRGDEIAPSVRLAFRSTPILFYSAVDEHGLRQLMADKLVEGAYCTHRDRLALRVGELVSDLSPALNRLAGMRGLAARIVAECDHELRLMLLHMGLHDGEGQSIVSALKERVSVANTSVIERISLVQDLTKLLSDHAVSSAALFHVARDAIRRHYTTDEHKAALRETKNYITAVVDRRNTLAHALEERTENGWQIKKADPSEPMTVGDFQTYRSDFLSQLNGLRRLRGLLVK